LKNIHKIIFDIVIAVLLVLMFNFALTGRIIHIILGALLFGLFIFHHLYNRKWIVQTTRGFFKKTTGPMQRVKYCLNVLLLALFSVTGVTGIYMVAVLITSVQEVPQIWLDVHVTSALFAMVLVMIHVGLHWRFFLSAIKKKHTA
jgi:hypothetical protein